jgi:uncharacterized membrane protein
VLILAVISLTKTLTSVRYSVEELRRESLPLINDAHRTVIQTNAELVKVSNLLDTAQSVGTTVDSASRLALIVVGNPIVKALAAGSGALRAARALRKSRA